MRSHSLGESLSPGVFETMFRVPSLGRRRRQTEKGRPVADAALMMFKEDAGSW